MLHVQNYLLNGKTHDDLAKELGIVVNHHPELPLTILNYDQIESPKTHPIIMECRGLVLHRENHTVVAKAFNRFFNWGEIQNPEFNFQNCFVQSKEDGSLVLIYKFDGQWRANTRGSFAQSKLFQYDYSLSDEDKEKIQQAISWSEMTWTDLICKALKINSLQELEGQLDDRYTYIAELVSPYNKVVRQYPSPQMYLLTIFEGMREVNDPSVFEKVNNLFKRPTTYNFKSIDEIIDFLDQQAKDDPTFEGVVICDDQFRRYKVKSPTYLTLHRMRGNGENLFSPKCLLPWILKGEADELVAYFPEVKEFLGYLKNIVDREFQNLEQVWQDNWQIPVQKDFALAIIPKTKFAGLLFDLRKRLGPNQTREDLAKTWRNAETLILKVLRGK